MTLLDQARRAQTNCPRCDWLPEVGEGPAKAQLREHALDSEHPLCGSCGNILGAHEPTIACESCLTTAREHLSGVVTMWVDLSNHLGHAKAQSYNNQPGSSEEHTLPGGTVLALLGPGSNGSAADSRGGREHGIDNDPTDPVSVEWTLETWAQDWYDTRGFTDDMPAPKVPALAGYLEVHARWAAGGDLNRGGHDAFAEWAQDMRELHARLEQATGRVRRPARADARCFDCKSGDLIRRLVEVTVTHGEDKWTGPVEETVPGLNGDLHPIWTCTTCSERYDETRYNIALRAEIEANSRLDVAGDLYATPAVVAGIVNRPERTIRNWASSERVRREVRNGVVFVNLQDAADLAETATRGRGGNRRCA